MLIYFLLVRLAARLGHRKARMLVEGQGSALEELRQWIEAAGIRPHEVIWIHASSVGEFEQARPLIERLKKEQPKQKVLLTFFSPSGYNLRKGYDKADKVTYLPFATKRNAKAWIDMLQPKMALFVKYEFWPAYLHALRQRDIPTYIISAIFRRGQLFFLPWGRGYRRLLHCYTELFVQDDDSRTLLERFGINHVIVAGDTRFDRVATIATQAKQLDLIERFVSPKDAFGQAIPCQVIAAGSTWPEDELLLARYVESHPNVRLILVPHEIHEQHLHTIFQRFMGRYVRYTEASPRNIQDCRILLVDTIGLLSSIYRYADAAYIGGGFGAGIHNTLEAAVYHIPVVFGPNYYKFREAKGLIAIGAAQSVKDYRSFERIMDAMLLDHEAIGSLAGEYIRQGQGATDKIYQRLFTTHVE